MLLRDKLSVDHVEGPVTHFCEIRVMSYYDYGLTILVPKSEKEVMEFLLRL